MAASLAVMASALVFVATPAHADDPAPFDVPMPQLAQILPWTVAGTTATAPYPGNMAPFGPISVDAPAQGLTYYADSSLQARPLTVPSGCLGSNTAIGYTAECATNIMTVTFPHPVINPVLALATGAESRLAPATQCSAQWQDVTFSSVNGATPTGTQVRLYSPADPKVTWSNNRLSYNPSVLQAAPCTAPAAPYTFLQVGGLVSSISFTLTTMQTITRNDPGTTMPDPLSPTRGVHMLAWVPRADLAIQKTGPSTVEAGGQVTWQIRVTNAAGSSTSHGFVVHDAVPVGVTNVSIASGGSDCTLSGNDLLCTRAPAGWTVAQNGTVQSVADLSGGDASTLIPGVLNAGATFGPIVLTGTAPLVAGTPISNSATVSGTDVDLVPDNNTSVVVTDVSDVAGLSLVKSATSGGSPVTALSVGETIDYAFLLTNTGTLPLSGVTVSELAFSGSGAMPSVTCPGTDLAAGASMTCTVSYVVTAADVAAGTVDNTAVAQGTAPGAPSPTQSNESSVQVPLAAGPLIELSKSGALAAGANGAAGDLVHYTFVATNGGDVPLTNVVIADALPGLSALTYNWPGAPGTLAPGQVVTATASYVLTQADVDAGSVVNTAITTGQDPTGTPVTDEDTATVPIAAAPGISLVKTGGLAPGATVAVGDTVDYTFAATNSGSVTLSNVSITDPLPGLSALTYTWPGTPGTLAPGETVSATATYVLTQADLNAGAVVNTATVTGDDPAGDPVTGDDTSTVPITTNPAITLVKTGGLAAGATGAVGDTLDYSFAATNSGDVTLTNVSIADPLPGLSALSYTWPGTPGTLAPGETVTATATYVLTAADIASGSVVNTATATGADPTGTPVTGDDTVTVPIDNAQLVLVKAGALAAGATGAAGDTVNYSFSATNSGNVTLTNVSITDPLPGLSALSYTWPGTPGTLAPGETATATAAYVLTQADVDAGSVVNNATVTGDDPTGNPVTGDDTSAVNLPAAPAVTLVKTGGLAADAAGAVGDTVDYSFAATNSGNVTLTNVAITDPLPGLSALTYTWPGTPGTLAPGQTVTATATYVLTQADVDAGSVVNNATATGNDPSDTPVTGNDTSTVPITPNPGITLAKIGGLAAGATGAVGDTVDFAFTATNTGNVALTNVSIADPLPGLSALTYSWPGTPGVLAPGQSVTATASYVLTQADVDAGSVTNNATASGDDPTGTPVTGNDTTTVPLNPQPGLSIGKTGGLAAGASGAVGDTVNYAFTATNTGNVTLTEVAITDPLRGLSALSYRWPGAPGTLAPGETVTATATYLVTAADVSAGRVTNTATATGADPRGGEPVTATSNTVEVALGSLAHTGSDSLAATAAAGLTALLLILTGLGVTLLRRNRRHGAID